MQVVTGGAVVVVVVVVDVVDLVVVVVVLLVVLFVVVVVVVVVVDLVVVVVVVVVVVDLVVVEVDLVVLDECWSSSQDAERTGNRNLIIVRSLILSCIMFIPRGTAMTRMATAATAKYFMLSDCGCEVFPRSTDTENASSGTEEEEGEGKAGWRVYLMRWASAVFPVTISANKCGLVAICAWIGEFRPYVQLHNSRKRATRRTWRYSL